VVSPGYIYDHIEFWVWPRYAVERVRPYDESVVRISIR